MINPRDYVVTGDTPADHIDLDEVDVRLPDGRRLDERLAESMGEQAAQDFVRRGRRSITGAGVSPKIEVRVSEALALELRALAERRGVALSQVAREALQEYAARQ